MEKEIEKNLPIPAINYPDGVCASDFYNVNESCMMIIKETPDFWKFYLHVK